MPHATPRTILDPSASAPPLRAIITVLACICIIASIVIRITGPSDIHDQTQPKTLSYTTDILSHPTELNHWILPTIQQIEPASKPPLYNWIAVPIVAVLGHQSIIAHKAPSLLAFIALIVILHRVGNRVIDPATRLTGPLAVIALSSNYAWFKLGYLARPDALLSLWLIIGWAAATALIGKTSPRTRMLSLIMWTATGLAALTKGPGALLIPLHAIVLRFILTRYQNKGGTAGTSRTGDEGHHRPVPSPLPSASFWRFLPIAILIPAAWLMLAYYFNPDHTYLIIIREEVIDRFFGTGAEGTKSGPWDWIRTAPNMPLYFMIRFLPWSFLFVIAVIDLIRKPRPKASRAALPIQGWPDARRNASEKPAHPWIIGAAAYTIIVVIFFSFSAGKRADYIASAYPTASIVIAWWLIHHGYQLAIRATWIIPCAALLTLTALAVNDSVWNYSAVHRFGESAENFAAEARQRIAQFGNEPLVFHDCNRGPFQIIQVLMGCAQPDAASEAHRDTALSPFTTSDSSDSLWLITPPDSLGNLLTLPQCSGWTFIPVITSDPASTSDSSGPQQVALYHAVR